ncbi:RICIN domain-containing protein [Streptomyces sp. NPDC050287]|uniref:RICIN domain-containing protein n=1 Tax=Streptomyces sp. NPDC050287 TaxID=3365608 RepID=UPI00378D3127
MSARHSGKVLDSLGDSAQGTQLVQWQDTGGEGQRWKLVDVDGAHYRLVNVRNGGARTSQTAPRATTAASSSGPPVPAPTSSGSSTPCDGTVRCGIPRPRRGPSHALGPGAEGVLGNDLGVQIGSRVSSSTALRAAPVTVVRRRRVGGQGAAQVSRSDCLALPSPGSVRELERLGVTRGHRRAGSHHQQQRVINAMGVDPRQHWILPALRALPPRSEVHHHHRRNPRPSCQLGLRMIAWPPAEAIATSSVVAEVTVRVLTTTGVW